MSGPDTTTTSVERGVGYCVIRSKSYKRRMGHLFDSHQTVTRVEGPSNLTGVHPSLVKNSRPGTSVRCSWCWKAAAT